MNEIEQSKAWFLYDVHLVSSSLVFVPSVVAEASIGVASSADIVFCRFMGGLGEVMLTNRLVLKRLNDETIKGDVGYCGFESCRDLRQL